jgi:hypothetical protein
MAKKASKKSNSKFNSAKKLFTTKKRKNLIISLILVVLVSASLFFAYQSSNKITEAKAAGWYLLSHENGASIRLCKSTFNNTTRDQTYRYLINNETNMSRKFGSTVVGFVAPYGSASGTFKLNQAYKGFLYIDTPQIGAYMFDSGTVNKGC